MPNDNNKAQIKRKMMIIAADITWNISLKFFFASDALSYIYLT